MPKLPFSVYDFFGYLASGFLLCAAVDFGLHGDWLLREKLPLSHAVFWTVAAYIVGHINASIASFVYERLIVSRFLGGPERNLFRQVTDWRAKVFPGYYTPLPQCVQVRVAERLTSSGLTIEGPGPARFHHARTLAKRDEITWANIQTFLHLYGFCRNISFALLLAGIWLILCGQLPLAGVSLFGSVGMFYRYLKFYRQYTFELFTAYPDLP